MYWAEGERYGGTPIRQATQKHRTDFMEFGMMEIMDKRKARRKCFQCEKVGYIHCNCPSAEGGIPVQPQNYEMDGA